MYSLRLTCVPAELDQLSAELWEAGTIGIHQTETSDGVVLIAGFESGANLSTLLTRFHAHAPASQHEPLIDWVEHTHRAWQAREVGQNLFLVPIWSNEATPPGRARLIHNPGLASGTGEHPCTRLALAALEKCVHETTRLVDVGTGSGILALAALRLGARHAICLDTDETALHVARENSSLNALDPFLIVGSAECMANEIADVTVVNINATVLLSIIDDLVRITRRGGRVILTGFPEAELRPFQQLLPAAEISRLDNWCCITAEI